MDRLMAVRNVTVLLPGDGQPTPVEGLERNVTTTTQSVIEAAVAAELPFDASTAFFIVSAFLVLWLLLWPVRRFFRRVRRREVESSERALWALSGYEMPNSAFRRWNRTGILARVFSWFTKGPRT